MVKYIFRAFVFVCLILIIVTVILVVSAIKKTENYLSSTGSIIGFHESSNAASVDSYNEKNIAPIISYNAIGLTYEVLGNFCSTSMKIGDKIDILYDASNPNKAVIKKGLFLAPIITGSLALLFGFLAIVYIFVRHKGIINI